MKKAFKLIINALLAMLVCIFLFLVFVAFNTRSASFIVESSVGGGFFYERSIRVFQSLLFLILYQTFYSTVFIFLAKKNKINNMLMKAIASLNIVICIFIYFYSAIFPWSIPLTR